jgi:hypothetical protein
MAQRLDANGVRLRWEVVPADHPDEEAVFTMYTGKRDPSNYPALVTAMRDFLAGLFEVGGTAYFNEIVGAGFFIDEYQTPILSADSWGNAYQEFDSWSMVSSGQSLPLQVAAVVSRQTLDGEISAVRSYNRSFLPYLAEGCLAPSALFSSAFQSKVQTTLVTLDSDLRADVPLQDGVAGEFEGLCNVSYKGAAGNTGPAQIMSSDLVWVGQVPDTMRSRRNALSETRTGQVVLPGGGPPSGRASGRYRIPTDSPEPRAR